MILAKAVFFLQHSMSRLYWGSNRSLSCYHMLFTELARCPCFGCICYQKQLKTMICQKSCTQFILGCHWPVLALYLYFQLSRICICSVFVFAWWDLAGARLISTLGTGQKQIPSGFRLAKDFFRYICQLFSDWFYIESECVSCISIYMIWVCFHLAYMPIWPLCLA